MRATAVFLHALVDVEQKHNYGGPWDLFKLVLARKELALVFDKPDEVDSKVVTGMLKLLRL